MSRAFVVFCFQLLFFTHTGIILFILHAQSELEVFPSSTPHVIPLHFVYFALPIIHTRYRHCSTFCIDMSHHPRILVLIVQRHRQLRISPFLTSYRPNPKKRPYPKNCLLPCIFSPFQLDSEKLSCRCPWVFTQRALTKKYGHGPPFSPAYL